MSTQPYGLGVQSFTYREFDVTEMCAELAEREAIPGDGRLDIPALLDSLSSETSLSQPLVIEYEANPADPTPAVVEAAEAVQDSMG